MTLNEALDNAAAEMNRAIAHEMVAYETLLQKHGATREELDRELGWYAETLSNWKKEALLEVKGWLERDGNTLH